MRLLRWLGAGCVAVVGLVLAFVAGVWCMKPAGDTTVDVAPTISKPTPTAPPTILKGDYQTLSHKPDVPVRPVNDTPKVPEPLKPASITPLPAEPLPSPILPVEARPSGAQLEPLIPPIPPIFQAAEPTPPSKPATKELLVQYVNKPELEFDYDVGRKGKSGVQSVTLFVRDSVAKDDKPTPQQKGEPMQLARPWAAEQPVGVKDDTNPKLRYTMSKDGRYEFRLGMTSRNGNASTPKDTDQADVVVVLDTKLPDISRFEAMVEPVTNTVAFRLDLTETNLDGTKPVVIEYRNLAAGQWQAVKLKEMTWAIPADAPAEVAFRVVVTDLAGNVATKTIDKLNLDTTIPEGKLTKVRAVEPGKKEEPPLPSPLPPPFPTLDLTPRK